MEKVKKLMRTTPNALLCVLGAIVFLFVFYSLAYRTPLWDVWLAPNMDNDEVIYNRQIVSVITHGGPQGYFGYDETHAAIGRYGGWGPILIWAYALPGFLFGSSINTVFWCNILFGILGLAIFARAARLNVWQQLVCAATLVCLWIPLTLIFCGSSESLHNALVLIAVGASAALSRRYSHGWFVLAAFACGFLTISRPYALLFWLFPLVALWHDGVRRRVVCGVTAAVSFVVALFNMTMLTAPYFSGSGLDFTALEMLKQGDAAGAVAYQMEHISIQLRTIWAEVLPTLRGNTTQTGAGCLVFLAILLVTVVCLVYDWRGKRPVRFKIGALICSVAIAVVLVVLYNVMARHLMLPCMLLLAALVIEDARPALVYVPVLAILLLPMNAQRSSLSTSFPEMADQITAVEAALTERVEARNSDDPWDNTLAYAYDDDVFHGYLYAVPAGMGIEFDWNTYLADSSKTIYSRYAMVNHGTAAEARLLADGWQEVISTNDLVVYERQGE